VGLDGGPLVQIGLGGLRELGLTRIARASHDALAIGPQRIGGTAPNGRRRAVVQARAAAIAVADLASIRTSETPAALEISPRTTRRLRNQHLDPRLPRAVLLRLDLERRVELEYRLAWRQLRAQQREERKR